MKIIMTSTISSIATHEIEQFSKVAEHWWDEDGPFKPLHRLNPVRLRYIRDNLLNYFKLTSQSSPLSGLRVLDIGCGGGLLSEPLARMGANVTAIDASPETIEIAKKHATSMGLEIDYRCIAPESLINEQFDVVFALEIVEHVADVAGFLKSCVKLVKPSGVLFLSTLNRTWPSYLAAIVAAENILGWVPKGTHDWDNFLMPSELAQHLRLLGFEFQDLVGLSFNPLKNEWKLSSDLKINYIGYTCFK